MWRARAHPPLQHLSSSSSSSISPVILLSLSLSLPCFVSPKRTEGQCLSEHICCPDTSMLVSWTKIRPSFLGIKVLLLFILSMRCCESCVRDAQGWLSSYIVRMLAHRQVINQCNALGFQISACGLWFYYDSILTLTFSAPGRCGTAGIYCSESSFYFIIIFLILTEFGILCKKKKKTACSFSCDSLFRTII